MNNTKEPKTQGVINSILGVMTKRQRIVKCPEHGYYLADEIWVGEEIKSQSTCPQCIEEHREEWKAKEEAFRKQQEEDEIKHRIEGARIPYDYRSKDFSTFKPVNETQQKALALAKRFVKGFEKAWQGGYGLIFLGACGTGKTHLACSIMIELIRKHKGFFPKYYRAAEIFSGVRDTYRNGSSSSEEEAINFFSYIPLLVIDEIGVQKGSDAERRILFSILENRMTDKYPTILISNLNAETLSDLIGERLYDRIKAKCVPALFMGESMRKQATADLFD